MAPPAASDSDLSNASFMEQIRQFGLVYWIANWMELVERFAYYGVRVVLPVFMVAAFEDGGPELTHVQKGTIYSVWAIVQSYVPIVSGGFADRYGFKLNIALSTIFKILGYLVMGYCMVLSEAFVGMAPREARAAGTDLTYELFFAGAMLLAFGTAIFKPGVQGLIAHEMPKGASSLGWALFYQMVNIGGFVGPLLAGYLRVLDWKYVFLLCAAGISLNFLALLTFAEPERRGAVVPMTPLALAYDAFRGLLEPRLFFFTLSFAGFWLMFYQLFDILPNFIDDWIDSRAVAASLISVLGEGLVPTVNGGNLTQEWMLNFNALLISCGAFAVGYVTGRVRSLHAIIFGIALSAVAIYALGMSMSGWWTLAAIGLFSLGEMSASPTKMRYLAAIAPEGKAGQYMGYVNFTVGIGWSLGSILAGSMYQEGGDRVVLASRYLVDHGGVPAATLEAMPRGDILPFFESTLGLDPWQARELLWTTYQPYDMWWVFTVIGVISMLLLVVYNHVVNAAEADPDHLLNRRGEDLVLGALVPITLALGALTWNEPSLGLGANTAFFFVMLLIATYERSAAQK
jgi:POT family proton-dependent oligopeptide transporter